MFKAAPPRRIRRTGAACPLGPVTDPHPTWQHDPGRALPGTPGRTIDVIASHRYPEPRAAQELACPPCIARRGSAGRPVTLAAAAAQPDAAPVRIVAAGNLQGDIARQFAGPSARVGSILSHADEDPHLFEASPAVARDLAAADIASVNGVDYDPGWPASSPPHPAPCANRSCWRSARPPGWRQPAPVVRPGHHAHPRTRPRRRPDPRQPRARRGHRGLPRAPVRLPAPAGGQGRRPARPLRLPGNCSDRSERKARRALPLDPAKGKPMESTPQEKTGPGRKGRSRSRSPLAGLGGGAHSDGPLGPLEWAPEGEPALLASTGQDFGRWYDGRAAAGPAHRRSGPATHR